MAVLSSPAILRAETKTLHVQTDASKVEYFITHTLSDVRNVAGPASGDIRVEPVRGGAWRIEGTVNVDLRGLDTGNDQRTKHVKSAEYLDVEKFPLATFTFATVSCDSPHVHVPPRAEGEVAEIDPSIPPLQSWKGRATGTLAMHGVTRDMEVPVVCAWEGDRLHVNGKLRIRLADHGVKRVKKMMMAAGENVDVTLALAFAP